jgi:TolB-like protein
MSLIQELKRRNVFRVGIAYAVTAWLLLQVADVVLNNIEAPDWVFQAIMLVLASGFPLILLFARAFELTPEGIKRETNVDRAESITRVTGKRLDRTIMVVMALALGYFAWDKFARAPGAGSAPASAAPAEETESVDRTPPEEQEKSIAVLPLANRSAREEDQYFTDGIHDDLLTQLAKIASLKVISRTSVMRYRDTELPIPEIAKQLGVSTILEGGIQRAGDQVRINVQLIEAGTDEHLWAETYDRQLTAENLFTIQSDITRRIVDALKASLTPEEAARIDERPTENLEALQEQMKGQQLLDQRTAASIEEARPHFERAIALDPGFAQAIVGLANTHHLLMEYAAWPEEESLATAMELLDQALGLNPDMGEAYMVRGELNRHRSDFEASESDFQRAMELIPGNATLMNWYHILKNSQNRFDEAYELLRRAHELDPMSRVVHLNYAMHPYWAGREEDALAELNRLRQLHPDYPAVYDRLALIYWNNGRVVDSLRESLKATELDPGGTGADYHCFAYLVLQAGESAIDCAALGHNPDPMFRTVMQIWAYLGTGDPAAARALLERVEDPMDWANELVSAAVAARAWDKALSLARVQHPEWFDAEQPVPDGPFMHFGAANAAILLMREGQNERATGFLNQALDNMQNLQRNRGGSAYGMNDVRAHALLGDREAALTALEECAQTGYLSQWTELKYAPFYDAIRDDPRFTAALERFERMADAAREQAIAQGLL